MSDPHDIEALAAVEHESWSGWTKWMLGEIKKELKVYPGKITSCDLSELACIRRWQRQMVTGYADLSEKEKESDRKVVREKLPAYRMAVPAYGLEALTDLLDDEAVAKLVDSAGMGALEALRSWATKRYAEGVQ